MRHIFVHIILCILAIPVTSRAQIGYQVSLLNTATGEPRAGVTVSAAVTITDSSDKIVYTGTQQATTNDFGVLSLAVGDDATFKNADWSKLPFFISVTVDGTLVGKSQILSVPVAEYAKKTGELTKEMLVGTWSTKLNMGLLDGSDSVVVRIDDWVGLCERYSRKYYIFRTDGTFEFSCHNYWAYNDVYRGDEDKDEKYDFVGEYIIEGNNVRMFYNDKEHNDGTRNMMCMEVQYVPSKRMLCAYCEENVSYGTYTKQ